TADECARCQKADESRVSTRRTNLMKCIIRPLTSEDEPFLWEMLYLAIHVPEGQSPPALGVDQVPELARYVQGWGRASDRGFLASDANTGQPVGAAWLRLLVGKDKGYGYLDDDTPELSVAVLPEYRGQGIGTQLLHHIFVAVRGHSSISLSVSQDNPALR